MNKLFKIFLGISRVSFDKKETLGASTHSCGGLLTVYYHRQTDIFLTFLGIKIKKLSSYKLVPVRYKRDYPLPATATDAALWAFRNGIETKIIHYEYEL